MNKKLIAIVLIVVAAVAGFLGWYFLMRPSSAVDIRYGGQYYPGEFLLYGLGSEFWQKYNITVEHTIFSSGGENNEALIAGTVDVNCGADTRTISLFNAIPDQALIIGTVQRGNRYTTIVKVDSPYNNWTDLKGKNIGITLGTGAEGVLRKYFDQEGLQWEDYNWINLNVEDMIANLESETIEAFHAWEPTPAIAEVQGVGRMLRTYGDIALVPASIHTTKDFANKNRDVIVRFLAAQLEKADMIKNDPENAAEIASSAAAEKGITVSPEAFEKVFARINFQIEFDETIIDAINETAAFLYEQGKIETIPELAWDTSFLEDAIELYQQVKSITSTPELTVAFYGWETTIALAEADRRIL